MAFIPARKYIVALPWILTVTLCASNALLLAQNLSMRKDLTKFQPESLARNEKVAPFSAPGLRGEIVDVSYSGNSSKRVLMYFSPSCKYCKGQSPVWRDIIARANEEGYEALGVVRSGENKLEVEKYLHSEGLDRLPIAMLPSDILQIYKLQATPTTIIVNGDGTVDKVWVGQYTDITVNRSLFDMILPFKQ